MSGTDEIPTTGEIRLEPHWPGVRRYVEAMFRGGSRENARDIAATMGCEAPNLEGMGCPNWCAGSETAHASDCPVGARERIS